MIHKTIRNLGIGIVLMAAATAVAGQFELEWYTIDGGGTMSSQGSAFGLHGTLGQTDTGVLKGGAFELSAGFWGAGDTAGASFGDCDGDGDVDLNDYEGFIGCITGPAGTLGTGCGCFDADGDSDIDTEDFGRFQAMFTGS